MIDNTILSFVFSVWKTLRFSKEREVLSATFDCLTGIRDLTFTEHFGELIDTFTVYVLVYNYEAKEEKLPKGSLTQQDDRIFAFKHLVCVLFSVCAICISPKTLPA